MFLFIGVEITPSSTEDPYLPSRCHYLPHGLQPLLLVSVSLSPPTLSPLFSKQDHLFRTQTGSFHFLILNPPTVPHCPVRPSVAPSTLTWRCTPASHCLAALIVRYPFPAHSLEPDQLDSNHPPLLPSCVTLGRMLNLSVPLLPQQETMVTAP